MSLSLAFINIRIIIDNWTRSDTIIEFSKVNKVFYDNNNKNVILKDINFNVKEGSFFGIVGNTGSGKSTILKLINGFMEPDSGNITIMGKELNSISKKDLVKETSMIFQSYNLLGNLTVIENILLPAKIRKTDKNDSYNKALELLEFVGLKGFEQTYIKNLSGGEKQRVAIARSLITNPKILLCDEPTSALDQNMSFEVLKLLKEINIKYNTTIILVSHDIETIKMVCNEVLILEDASVSNIVKLSNKDIIPMSYMERLKW